MYATLRRAGLTYGVDDQRRKSVYKENGATKLTRYYAGDYEEEVDALGNVKQIHYLSGAILIRANGVETLYYSYADYQGSLMALTDESGKVVERYAYDPWGARRNPDDWTEKDNRTTWIVNRGYTGHEHLDAFGIINMNGRVYDPLTAMFFSPDPYVQAPDKWLNYNRYGYCLNNPFKYTDPSGEFWHLIIGAAIGGVLNWVTHGCQFNAKGLGYFGVGALAGALGAGVGAGIGSSLAGGSFSAGFWGTSAAAQGTVSFFAGAATGAGGGATGGFTSGFGNALVDGQNIGNAFGQGLKGGIIGGIGGGIIGGITQGLDAALNGKANFWDGHINVDLSNGAGASNIPSEIATKLTKAYYVGKYEDAGVFESAFLGNSKESGGLTIPKLGIIVGKGVYQNRVNFPSLFQHEYGHVLQFKMLEAVRGTQQALQKYYSEIGMASFSSATLETLSGGLIKHNSYWYETWANYLASNYFGSRYITNALYPSQNLSFVNFFRLFLAQ